MDPAGQEDLVVPKRRSHDLHLPQSPQEHQEVLEDQGDQEDPVVHQRRIPLPSLQQSLQGNQGVPVARAV